MTPPWRIVADPTLLPWLLRVVREGTPVEEWGTVRDRIGGGRAPLLAIELADGSTMVAKRIVRGGWLGRLLGGTVSTSRVLAEQTLSETLRSAGVAVPRPRGVVMRASSIPGWSTDVVTLMEWIERGKDLATWLRTSPSPSDRSTILAAAGRGVAAMHRVGVDHEDLNLRNLLVATDGVVHVLDLGGSRRRRGGSYEPRNLARLYRSGVKWGLVPSVISRQDVARFLRGYDRDRWRQIWRDTRRHYLRTAWLHQLLWRARGRRINPRR